MKIYEGKRTADGCIVNIIAGPIEDGRAWKPLPLRLDLAPKSPTGFEWGYAGSGPAQLALALCADVVGDERALRIFQQFKFRHVGVWHREGWRYTEEQLRTMISTLELEQ